MDARARVREAMRAVPRTPFLPEDQRPYADLDRPLPTGHDSTNSQPTTVRTMLELLDVPPGARVLDVGCGTGWTCGLLAYLAGPAGSVTGVEIVPQLADRAREHLREVATVRVEVVRPGEHGWPDAAPYDRILVSANAREVPQTLTDQLGAGGRMVLPVQGSMTIVQRVAGGRLEQSRAEGRYAFVPLR